MNYSIKEVAVIISQNLHGQEDPVFEALVRRIAYERDRMFQALMNNLWANNPGELDRWADDGGFVP